MGMALVEKSWLMNGREMRGYITNPHVSLELNDKRKLDVRGVVGTNGTITVIKDLNMKEPFSGQYPSSTGSSEWTLLLLSSFDKLMELLSIGSVNPDETVRAAGGFRDSIITRG